jgi:copper chaperone CopZ
MNPRIMFLASATSIALFSAVAGAADVTYTTINVEKMCCQGCVQKVAAQLYAVKGVKEVRASIKKRTVYVLPQRGKVLSPRSLWVAVEQADDRPLKLAGPSGVFTTRPRR